MFALRIEPEYLARFPVKEDVSLARTGRKASVCPQASLPHRKSACEELEVNSTSDLRSFGGGIAERVKAVPAKR